jgi:hypothetical protein
MADNDIIEESSAAKYVHLLLTHTSPKLGQAKKNLLLKEEDFELSSVAHSWIKAFGIP